ncbi:DUF3854 domain-containing protein [Methylacidimicrobium tartarophylax]|uniref:DUF3854 domain-containing protein n=1 Tax=Methylacidimicrobium tartarophylax TaxID=1041768 RepID=A0A5E6MDQ0_9BACT|nr:DUF3854 domain-containing protein [Methylacidimicrobium tartarophylax]VVM07591.1 hypothetical protein MAMT_01817 [Methylacidimicrobium tartarophylax]
MNGEPITQTPEVASSNGQIVPVLDDAALVINPLEAYLTERGIRRETWEAAGVELIEKPEPGLMKDRLGFDRLGQSDISSAPGIWFPYKDEAGKIRAWGFRTIPELHNGDGEPVKFLRSKGSGTYPFVGPKAKEVLDKAHKPMILTEGAVKALAIEQAGGFALGLTGCWLARSKNGDNSEDAYAMPEWEGDITWQGRSVSLALDADLETNPSVRTALFANLLALRKAGAVPRLLRWNLSEGKGIDDWAARKEDPAAALQKLMDEAVDLSQIIRPEHLVPFQNALDKSNLSPALRKQISKEVAKPLKVAAKDLQDKEGGGSADAKARALYALAKADVELFHDGSDGRFVRFNSDGHRETWPIQSSAAKEFFQKLAYDNELAALSGEVWGATVNLLSAEARFSGKQAKVFLRVAPEIGPDGNLAGIFVDLCDANWRAVHVTANGWEILDRSPVLFIRSATALPLPTPERGGNLEELRGFLNPGLDDGSWLQIKAFLAFALHPIGPYPLLELLGEQGSGKSTAARFLRSLIDPSKPKLRAAPKTVENFCVAAENCWLPAFDNLSYINDDLSDALCRLSTGGGFGARRLYSNNEERVLDAKRPAMWTGINEVAMRGDLVDRTISIELPSVPEESRKQESEVEEQFRKAAPKLFGALLSRIAGALRELSNVRLDRLPRMADFATFAVAAERGAVEPERFLDVYRAERTEASARAVEGSPAGAALMRFLETHNSGWEGSPAELLSELQNTLPDPSRPPRGFPDNSRSLGKQIRRLAPSLRRMGWDVGYGHSHKSKKIYFQKITQKPAQPAQLALGIDCQHVAGTPVTGADKTQTAQTAQNGTETAHTKPLPNNEIDVCAVCAVSSPPFGNPEKSQEPKPQRTKESF